MFVRCLTMSGYSYRSITLFVVGLFCFVGYSCVKFITTHKKNKNKNKRKNLPTDKQKQESKQQKK